MRRGQCSDVCEQRTDNLSENWGRHILEKRRRERKRDVSRVIMSSNFRPMSVAWLRRRDFLPTLTNTTLSGNGRCRATPGPFSRLPLHSRTPSGDVIPTMASFIRPSISSIVASASPACRLPSAEKRYVGDPDGLRFAVKDGRVPQISRLT
jgi:hypothetical protein